MSINSHGFHDVERKFAKAEGSIRNAVLGDLYTEALQVPREKNFCSIIEHEMVSFDVWSDRKVEVLNFRVSGYGTAQELLLLRKRVKKYSPDVVVLAIFTGNDIRNNSKDLESTPRPFFVWDDGNFLLDSTFNESDYFRRRNSLAARLNVQLSDHSRIFQAANRYRQRLRSSAQTDSLSERKSVERGLDYTIYREPTDTRWIDRCGPFYLYTFLVPFLAGRIGMLDVTEVRGQATTCGPKDLRRVVRLIIGSSGFSSPASADGQSTSLDS